MRVESIKRPPGGGCRADSVMFESCKRSGDDVVVAMVGHRRHGLCSRLYEPVNKGLNKKGREKPIVDGLVGGE